MTLIGRAPKIPRLNRMKWTVFPGFARGFPDLPAEERLAFLSHIAGHRIAPPRHTVQRIARTGARALPDAAVTGVEAGPPLRIATTAGVVEADRVILGTGFAFDLFLEDAGLLRDRLNAWADPELLGDEWPGAV